MVHQKIWFSVPGLCDRKKEENEVLVEFGIRELTSVMQPLVRKLVLSWILLSLCFTLRITQVFHWAVYIVQMLYLYKVPKKKRTEQNL